MAGNVPEYAWNDGNDQQEPTEGVDFREYLLVLFKFKWGIISVALLTALIGMYMAYKAVPIYRSTVILQIEREQNNPLNSGFFFPDYEAKFYETQRELIRSWAAI